MARPLRIEYPGAMYHVMNRGNQRRNVFGKKVDCETFLEKLEYFSELFNVKIYCYALMNNHFHLLLRTEEANLGRFMQSFLTSFTVALNRRNRKSGHIFQGRYKAQLVESEEYMSKLSRYIHLNPVRVKKYAKLPIEEKRSVLRNYAWSSFGALIGLKPAESFLDMEPVLATWGRNRVARMKNYREYVEEGLCKEIENPFDLAIRQMIIGSESFADRITRTNILKREIKDRKEEAQLHALQTSIEPMLIIRKVAEYFRTDIKEVLKRRGKAKEERKIAMYMCARYSISCMTLTEIGKLFSVSISGLTRARDRVGEKIEDNESEISKKIEEIKKSIAEV